MSANAIRPRAASLGVVFGVAVVDAPNPRDTQRGCTEGQPKPPKRGRIIRTLTVTLIALTLTSLSTAGEPRTSGAYYSAACADAHNAVRWYRTKYNTHRAALGRTLAPPVEQAMGCHRLRERAKYWQQAAALNRKAAEKHRHYHYAWWDWMPTGWQNIGACETGYGKRPGRFDWNSGTYQGFAGFYHGSWDAFVASADPKAGPYPSEAYNATPRQQYEVALAIYRRYGLSGWGCRGAFSR